MFILGFYKRFYYKNAGLLCFYLDGVNCRLQFGGIRPRGVIDSIETEFGQISLYFTQALYTDYCWQ